MFIDILLSRTPRNLRSIPSFASWQRDACYPQSTSAQAASERIRSAIMGSPALSIRISRRPSGVTLVSRLHFLFLDMSTERVSCVL
jgi:hypothetical protein